MRIRWRGLELPTKVELDPEISTANYGRLSIEPFERGFGITVGNSLRRILLSSLEGSAVTSIKIAGAPHEFMSLPGVRENITEIVLNIKSLVVCLEGDEPRTMRVNANQAGPVTAGAIETDPFVTILDKDHVLATLTDDIEFSMEMVVETGRGYVPASREEEDAEEQELGIITVDAIFSPVRRVRYKTEETRVGQLINYDRLIMEIWTDGTIGPELALVESAKILRKHLGPLVQYFELGADLAEEVAEDLELEEGAEDDELQEKMALPLKELELTVRANHCLEMANIETLGQLIQMGESELLMLRSFGKTSLREVKRKLEAWGLVLQGAKEDTENTEEAEDTEETSEDDD